MSLSLPPALLARFLSSVLVVGEPQWWRSCQRRGSSLQQGTTRHQDSPKLMYQDIKRANWLNYSELAHTVADHSVEAFEWAKSLWAKFDRVNYHSTHAAKRGHQLKQSSGSKLVVKQYQKAKELVWSR
ncbi:MAG: hypothetical protein ACR5K7_01655 [Symbiopectobacterium sp.]